MEQIKKRPELLHCSQSHNILRDLMLRDFGFLYYNCYKTKTRALESIAETNLVGKKHKELVIIELLLCRILIVCFLFIILIFF